MIRIFDRVRSLSLFVFLPLAACSAIAPGSTVKLSGVFSGSNEVPAVSSGGSGTVEATLDKATSRLHYRVVYSGLSGPARAAHFHGPAEPGKNAPVVLGFKSPVSPIEDEAVLTAAQVADVLAGRWYANVHTAAHPGGEIRAQLQLTN
jgi:hypothetical protein